MKKFYKIGILLFVLFLTVSVVSAGENSTDTQHEGITKKSDSNFKSDPASYYTVSPAGKGVGKTDGNLFETIDYTERNDEKVVINVKSGTYNFSKKIINGTYHSNRHLGKYNITKNISFIGEDNTVFNADDARFFHIQNEVTAEFVNIKFINGYYEVGGSIYSEGNVILRNCSFINSSALDYGGTLYLRGSNIIENTEFINSFVSASQDRGVIYLLRNNQTKLNNVSFINNSVDCIHASVNNLSINNSFFVNNKCNYPICLTEDIKHPGGNLLINNSYFGNNEILSAVGLFLKVDNICIQNSRIINNTYAYKDEYLPYYIPNAKDAHIKNNTCLGNNLSNYMIGNLSKSIIYNTQLNGTLRLISNNLFNVTVNTGKVSVYVDNKLYGNYGVFDGYVYVKINNLSKGNHSVKIKYFDDTNSFTQVERTFNVIVGNRIVTKVIGGDKYAFAGGRVTFNASVVGYDNKPLTTGRMVIKINGKTLTSISLRNTNKIRFNYNVPDYTAKNYKLQYIYVGDGTYARYEANRTLHVLNQLARITANPVVNYQGQNVAIKVRIVGKETGIPASVGTVGFKMNWFTVKVNGQPVIERVKNGWTTFNYKIPQNMKAGEYKIMVTYSGGRNIYNTRLETGTLTVKDHTTKISIKTKTVKQSKTNKIMAEVKDSISEIKTGRASLYLNDMKVSETGIQNGQAIFNYFVPDMFLGKYAMKISAKGTYTDENSSKSTLTVVK